MENSAQPSQRVSILRQMIGSKAVAKLASVFPGQRIYVPWAKAEAMEKFRENFTPLIGADCVERLLTFGGGLRFAIPIHCGTVPRSHKPISTARVMELTKQGLTSQQIAKILKCDPRSVHLARAKARKGLFGRKRKASR